jgi:hypothetical protein
VADAQRDAATETSTLPLFTLAMKDSDAVIGRDLDRPLANPLGVRVFGSRDRYEALLGAELNPADPHTTWRLLVDTGNQLLVIPTLPQAKTTGKAPLVGGATRPGDHPFATTGLAQWPRGARHLGGPHPHGGEPKSR